MRSRALCLAALAFLVGLSGFVAVAPQPAQAQQLDAGKPPSQIFSSTCAVCHRSPRGLVKTVPPGSLPGFLRQHYTTGAEMAGIMAAYVLGSGGTDRVAEPPKREPKQRARGGEGAGETATRAPAADGKELPKREPRHRAAKKGKADPADAAKHDAAKSDSAKGAAETDKEDAAKPEAGKPTPSETKPEGEPATQPAGESKPAAAEPSQAPHEAPATEAKPAPVAPAQPVAPRQPTGLSLPGFPPPVVEPDPAAPAAPAAAPAEAPPAAAPPADAPKRDSSSSDTKLDIMREDAPAARVGQKK